MMKSVGVANVALLLIAAVCFSQAGRSPVLKMESVMTSEELRETGVSTLSPGQRRALDRWLERYTGIVLRVAASPDSKPAPSIARPSDRGDCSPAVDSTISGDFEGWDGETLFKLDNGQIWEQAEYDYTYSYQYRPDVTIYSTASGCRMKVEDENETILVRRVK